MRVKYDKTLGGATISRRKFTVSHGNNPVLCDNRVLTFRR